MDKEEQIIMAIGRDILFKENYFQGFAPQTSVDFEKRILDNFKWIKRGFAEKSLKYKHPITYSIIINPELKQIFSYQRAKEDKDYPEKKLQGRWSWGVGGHIEKSDSQGENPIYTSMLREATEEEVEFINHTKIEPSTLGYINDDSDKVGPFHFGILYLIKTDAQEIKPKDKEIAEGRYRTIQELEDMCNSPEFNVENWSRIALNPLKRVLINLSIL